MGRTIIKDVQPDGSFMMQVPAKYVGSDSGENIDVHRKRLQDELKQMEAIHKTDVMPELWPFVEEHRKRLRHDLNLLCNKYL